MFDNDKAGTLNIRTHTGGMTQTNGYLFEAPEGRILVDAPEGVADWLRGENVEVGVLLLTHGHYDHVVDAAQVRRDHGCPIVAQQPVTPDLTLVALLASMGLPVKVEEFDIDHELGEAESISYLGQEIRVLHVPGHSPDSVCYLPARDDPEAAPVIFGGDVLFRGSIGRTDFPHGNHVLLIEGIRAKLFALPDAAVIYPGHGPPTTIGEEKAMNPYVRG